MNKAGKQAQENNTEDKKGSDVNSVETNETLEKLLRGEDIFETIDTKRGKFTIIFPRPRVLRQIQVLLASRFRGADLNLIPSNVVRNYEAYAALDIVVTQGPAWWDKLETSEDCPDDDLILTLYRGYLRFYGNVQSQITSPHSKPGRSVDASGREPEKAVVDSGAFSGIAHGPTDDRTLSGAD